MTPTRLCYIITSPRGFLIELWDGVPSWGPAAQQAMANRMAWLDLAVANQKLKLFQALMPELTLGLELVEFRKDGTDWVPLSQRGVR